MSFFYFSFLTLLLFLSLLLFCSGGSLFFNFISFLSLPSFSFSYNFDTKMIWFLLMIFFVTSLVSLYSEVYMEHYNNFKFFILMISFFLSMMFLILSESFFSLVMCWDFLGLTSLCLIMFYPNKSAMFNSFLTSFFNRLGDVLLVFCFSLLLGSPLSSFFNPFFPPFILFLILICGFTKSAQFPLSSWLPAAMSAPTPISAMVHSSTLVTAGVLLYQKISFSLESYGFNFFILLFSLLTFFLGGLMANYEGDLKKVVAFSTMSQISMIIVFCGLLLFWMSISLFTFQLTTYKSKMKKNSTSTLTVMFILHILHHWLGWISHLSQLHHYYIAWVIGS